MGLNSLFIDTTDADELGGAQTSKPDFLSGDDLEVYTKAFTGYDRMRAGFEVYRAFLQDRDDVRNDIKQNGKLGANVPVLASGGTKSKFTEVRSNSRMRTIQADRRPVMRSTPRR